MTLIALDAMGGDDAPAAPLDGALIAAREGIEVALVGDEATIAQGLAARGGQPSSIRIVHAAGTVGMGDKAARDVRHNRDTSLYVGAELVKRREADALVTMGNTGAAMATALVVLGRIRGVERPALGAVLPTGNGVVLFLDVGANADARPSQLVQFARMGAVYLRAVHGMSDPRVALLSIGEEASKGSSLVIETHELLTREPGIRFTGNIESRDLLTGQADVIVTDGFTGNACLKMAEGIASLLFGEIRSAASSSLRGKLGGLLLMPSLRSIRGRLDYRQYGAVPLLGVDGGVFIGHGRSDGAAVASGIRAAHRASEQGMVAALAASMAKASDAGLGGVPV